uniref:Uncharacterized protein n=1 Tax=Timema tahoe TaxID=61484 RepID=A0A7R9INI7_9NEOP|nr:unnamed protein product [Timema tahoe]
MYLDTDKTHNRRATRSPTV